MGDLAAELRALADVLVERVEPWLATLAAPTAPTAAGEVASSCSWCPVCALVAALRGERPELTRRLVEEGTGLLNAVRQLIAEHGTAGHGTAGHGTAGHADHPEHSPHGDRRPGPASAAVVEPIVVRRRDATT